ncbi:hypothetical protein BpHYR1_027510 [Brachionus plicatilis]|uniref:Uncharacterized protein n=1 Tax=Brachionus plicatilis TaxID=10195 RepID=A0A3M7RYT9_BRAPC|nr:hypothetical protein BpHYR1_027510 [Brachionus plicatilis]
MYEGIVPLGSSERRSAFFSVSLLIDNLKLKKKKKNFKLIYIEDFEKFSFPRLLRMDLSPSSQPRKIEELILLFFESKIDKYIKLYR